MRLLAGEGLGADVSTGGELEFALRARRARRRESCSTATTSRTTSFALQQQRERSSCSTRSRRSHVPARPASRRCSSGSRRGSKPTHISAIRTAHAESKFGLDPADAVTAVAAGLDAGLDVAGLHVHIGSQLTGSAQSLQAVDSPRRGSRALPRRARVDTPARRPWRRPRRAPHARRIGARAGSVREGAPDAAARALAAAARCRCCSNRAARSSAPRASRSIESAASSAAAASPMPPWTAACPTIRARSSTARATRRCSRIAPARRRRARSGSRASTASPATC